MPTNETKMTRAELDAYIEKLQKESAEFKQKTDSEIEVIRKEAELIRKETDIIRKETEAINKECRVLEKKMFDLGVNIGSASEFSIYSGITKSNTLQNILFNNIYQNISYLDKDGKTLTEADIILVNGKYAAIVEVKHRVNKSAIQDFVNNKLPIIKNQEKLLHGKKILLYIGGDSIEKKSMLVAKKLGIGILLNDSAGVVEKLDSAVHKD